jgi:hypothetical protein
VYLVAFGLSWLIFLYFDIRRHQDKIRAQALEAKANKERLKSVATKPNLEPERKHHQHKQRSGNGANPAFRFASSDHSESPFNRHGYIFCHSRHSGSFYLKIGAAGYTHYCFDFKYFILHHFLL